MKDRFRVIWQFEDGRRRYAINNKNPELWGDWELSVLERRMKETQAAYSNDFKIFAIDINDLIKLGYKNCIRVTGFTIEHSSEPLQQELIF